MTSDSNWYLTVWIIYYSLINAGTIWLVIWAIKARKRRLQDRNRYLALWADTESGK